MSPFSRVGPGIGKGIKPDVVAYGGNTVWNSFDRVEPNNLGTSTISLHYQPSHGLFRAGVGTSYSTPRVAHLAAEIWEEYPDASADLVRALIGLSTVHPDGTKKQFEDADQCLQAFGYGMPTSQRAIESNDGRAVMMLDDIIEVDTAIIVPVPIPEAFARGAAKRTVSVALAFAPPVRRQRREYIAGTFRMKMYRNMSFEDVEAIVKAQDRDNPNSLPGDRRDLGAKLLPGADRVVDSTLQVRRWNANIGTSMSVDDRDMYYLTLRHFSQGWAHVLNEPYERQPFGLAVSLEDRSRSDIKLYSLVQQQVSISARLRIQP